jgi:hypothetical protein
MRKLTVKNFSVIKEAELEFGKITVLIGPQSSGKSLLCKLAFFLTRELVGIATSSILNGDSWEEYLQAVSRDFWSRFSPGPGLVSQSTKITFAWSSHEVSMSWGPDSNDPDFKFSNAFREQYELMLIGPHQDAPSVSGAYVPGGISPTARRQDIWVALNQLLSGPLLDGVVYIPAGRSFFTNASKGVAALQNPGIDSITREFSGNIQWDSRWKVGLMTTGRGVTDEINRRMTDILQGFVMIDSGIPRFLASDGRNLPLEALSSGAQELTPLFNILDQLMYYREHSVVRERANYDPPQLEKPIVLRPFIYIEEPEANIFPETQYSLVQVFAWLANDPILDFQWAITTHSPYLLSAFNDLIEAGRLGAEGELRAEVNNIIPEKYWVKPGDFKAYSIHDGQLESIMDKETGLINGEYLDAISNKIGGDFDALLRIGYAKS